MSVITLILKGSNSKKIKEWMKDLTYFGSMRTLKLRDVNTFVYKAIEQGYIEDCDIGDCFRVLKCTNQGIEFGKEYETKLGQMMKDKNDEIIKLVLD